jgi:meso-butanediol dehydrogenase/(S,S)-butanediol dehydrogenase/diacetyl reductase
MHVRGFLNQETVMELDQRVAIVTGAVGVIGRGICEVLLQRGMKVVVADLDGSACERYAAECRAAGGQAQGVAVNVTSKASVTAMAHTVLAQYGQIDVLVNNAGIIALGPLVTLAEADWDRVIDVNLKGSFLCAQAVAPTMMAQRRGRIINFSSVAGKRPTPLQSAYAATKHGVMGLTQVWCQELGPYDITVNTVCPGFIDSPMWSEHLGPAFAGSLGVTPEQVVSTAAKAQMPLGRPQQPRDLGEAVAYLCSADNVTGQALVVDGGFSMC